jgi:5-methyltetrahydrofolate--homocysteine methyltransferase
MMTAYYSYCALSGADPQCMDYISHYSVQTDAEPAKAVNSTMTLAQAIISGLKESAHALAEELVKSIPPLTIINEEMVPALDKVGKQFEQGTLFLPQLLMSAEAAKAAFEAIRVHMDTTGEKQVKKDKIVLATVKGDIHDIGKNIVKVLLENYSYDVIDLGKDVNRRKSWIPCLPTK